MSKRSYDSICDICDSKNPDRIHDAFPISDGILCDKCQTKFGVPALETSGEAYVDDPFLDYPGVWIYSESCKVDEPTKIFKSFGDCKEHWNNNEDMDQPNININKVLVFISQYKNDDPIEKKEDILSQASKNKYLFKRFKGPDPNAEKKTYIDQAFMKYDVEIKRLENEKAQLMSLYETNLTWVNTFQDDSDKSNNNKSDNSDNNKHVIEALEKAVTAANSLDFEMYEANMHEDDIKLQQTRMIDTSNKSKQSLYKFVEKHPENIDAKLALELIEELAIDRTSKQKLEAVKSFLASISDSDSSESEEVQESDIEVSESDNIHLAKSDSDAIED